MGRSNTLSVIACFGIVCLAALPLEAQPVIDQCSLDTPTVEFGGGGNPSVQTIISVTDDETILDSQAEMNLTHAFVGDVVMTLTSPNATVVTLHANGGGADDDIHVTYSGFGIPNDPANYNCFCEMLPAGPGAMADFNLIDER